VFGGAERELLAREDEPTRREFWRQTPEERRRALAIPRALATLDPGSARRVLDEAGVEPDYVAVADLDGPTLAVAARVGSTRLIDNVLLEGDKS
jgi:pantothenate synthetase